MTRLSAGLFVVLTAAIVALALVIVGLRDQQHEQERALSRLTTCVSILERNQSTPSGEPIMGCPVP